MLPRVKIYFENGNLGLVPPSADGVLGIIGTGVTVGSTFELAKPYQLFKLADLATLGVTELNNPAIFKLVKDFYTEAGDGTEVWLMALPDTVKLSAIVDKDQPTYGRKLVDAANGKLRGLVISRKPGVGYTPEIEGALDKDVYNAAANAQIFAEYYTDNKYAPLFVAIEGYAFTGETQELFDLTNETYDRVAVFIGATTSGSATQAVGTLAGRIAKSPVQRNIARFKDGPVKGVTKAFLKDTPVELANVTALHDKGYITFRTFVNQSGYYFNDDFIATKATDDYSHITARRTIDKAYRIAYNTLLQYLLDEVPVNTDGTLPTGFVKSAEATVENAIAAQMTAKGELSGDVTTGDKGVVCFINAAQNIVSTSTLKVQIRVRPFGYPRFIDVYLGFTVLS